jgi:hypothetical protein
LPWSSKFDAPIFFATGRKLVTLKDAGAYITELLKSEHDAPEWQTTTERSQHWKCISLESVENTLRLVAFLATASRGAAAITMVYRLYGKR